MCDYSLGVYDKGVEKGIKNTLIENIKNVMEGFGVSLERALDVLKVPKSDYAKYEKLLK